MSSPAPDRSQEIAQRVQAYLEPLRLTLLDGGTLVAGEATFSPNGTWTVKIHFRKADSPSTPPPPDSAVGSVLVTNDGSIQRAVIDQFKLARRANNDTLPAAS